MIPGERGLVMIDHSGLPVKPATRALFLPCLLALLLFASLALADTLILKDGRTFSGRLVRQTGKEVVFEVHGYNSKIARSFPRDQVASITKGEVRTTPVARSRPATEPKDAKPPCSSTRRSDDNPLASPESLVKWSLKGAPRSPKKSLAAWSRMTTLQKEQALKKYRLKLSEWQKRRGYRGKKVTWVLSVVDITSDKKSEGYILTARSELGFFVTATIPADAREVALKLRKGDMVEVTGAIVDYSVKFTEGKRLFEEDKLEFSASVRDVSIKPAKQGQFVRFLGLSADADSVVYLIDKSGSMANTLDYVKVSIVDSVNRLDESQQFHVILFADKSALENPPKKLVKATKESKTVFIKFIGPIQASGKTNVIPALKRAFAVLHRSRGRKKAIILLTDGDFPNNKAVLRTIAAANRNKTVHVWPAW